MSNLSNEIRELLLKGHFGIEEENLRITGDGFFSKKEHQFPDDEYIVRDFCENQIEINTAVNDSAEEVLAELTGHLRRVDEVLKTEDPVEYRWKHSSPPYIRGDRDIPIAQFRGVYSDKTIYRNYLSRIYGKYKMTFSGIHVNYSFDDRLIDALFAGSGESDRRLFKDGLYLRLAEGLVRDGWIITMLLAASPLLDGSFFDPADIGKTAFSGMASVRCSELGYWNTFAPMLKYGSIEEYAGSIQSYIDDGLIIKESEFYYPVRLKSTGENSLSALKNEGVSHIELRNGDLNPFEESGLNLYDLKFIQLLIIYETFSGFLLSGGESFDLLKPYEISKGAQIGAVRNFKYAAHYDIDDVTITDETLGTLSAREAGARLIDRITGFYDMVNPDGSAFSREVLQYEKAKLTDDSNRYATKVKELYSEGFVEKAVRDLK